MVAGTATGKYRRVSLTGRPIRSRNPKSWGCNAPINVEEGTLSAGERVGDKTRIAQVNIAGADLIRLRFRVKIDIGGSRSGDGDDDRKLYVIEAQMHTTSSQLDEKRGVFVISCVAS